MKIAAYISLSVAVTAAVAGLILQIIKIRKTGKSDRWTVGAILFAILFILFGIVNLIWIIPNL